MYIVQNAHDSLLGIGLSWNTHSHEYRTTGPCSCPLFTDSNVETSATFIYWQSYIYSTIKIVYLLM